MIETPIVSTDFRLTMTWCYYCDNMVNFYSQSNCIYCKVCDGVIHYFGDGKID